MLRNHLPYNKLRLWNQALIKKNLCIRKSKKAWLQSKWDVDFLISKNFSTGRVQAVNVLRYSTRYSSHSKWHKLSRPSVQFIYFSYMDLARFTLVTYTVMIKHYFCLSRWCEHWHKDKKIFCLLFYVHALTCMLLLWHNKVCQDVHTVKKNKTSLCSYLVILMSPGQEKKIENPLAHWARIF